MTIIAGQTGLEQPPTVALSPRGGEDVASNDEVEEILAQLRQYERDLPLFVAQQKEAKKAKDKARYEASKAAGALPQASVPHAYAKRLREAFESHHEVTGVAYWAADDLEVFEYGFRFLAYLLSFRKFRSMDKEYRIVPQEIRWALAGTRKTTKVSAWTTRLEMAHIIQLVKHAHFSQLKGYRDACVYRIHPDLVDMLLVSNDNRFYTSAGQFLDHKDYKPKALKTLGSGFMEEPNVDDRLREAVKRLQSRHLLCNVKALREAVRSFDPKDQKKHRHLVQWVQTANYTQYRLARSGRVQTSGRLQGLAGSQPKGVNLQSIPKVLRQHFYPEQVDHVFLDLDFKSQEAYILAVLSGDEKLLEVLATGDVYQMIADEFNLDRNRHGKPMFNATNYGGQFKAIGEILWDDYEVTKPTRQQLKMMSAYFQYLEREFPIAYSWLKSEARRIKRSRTALVPNGVTRTDIPSRLARRVGVNHLIQGLAATIMWEILRNLDDNLGDFGYTVLPMHDGLVLSVRRDAMYRALGIAKRTMRDACRKVLGIEIPVTRQWGWRHKDDDQFNINRRPE